VHGKRHGRQNDAGFSGKEDDEVTQFGRDPEHSNDGVNPKRRVVLNKPDGCLPLVIQENRMQRVLNQFVLDVVSTKPTQSGVAQLAQSAK